MDDILTAPMRRLLDILGNGGHIIEWRPTATPETVVVVWPDETAARVTVEETPDPWNG